MLSYRVLDFWTPTLRYAPRWINANRYPEIGNVDEIPDVSWSAEAFDADEPTDGEIPTQWILTAAASSVTTDLLQNLVFQWAAENQKFSTVSRSVAKASRLGFDASQTPWIWTTSWHNVFTTIEVKDSSGQWHEIPPAFDDLDFFYSGEWRWIRSGTDVFFAGFDVVQATTYASGGWQYLDGRFWDRDSEVWIRHPESSVWRWLHPDDIRSDGFVYLYHDESLVFRNRSAVAGQALDVVAIRFDGIETTAHRVPVVNTLDFAGLYFEATRRSGEDNAWGDVLTTLGRYGRRQTYAGLSIALGAKLRSYFFDSLTASASSVTLSASGVVDFLDLPETFVVDTKAHWCSGDWRVPYRGASWHQAYFNGVPIESTLEDGVLTTTRYVSETGTIDVKLSGLRWVLSGNDVILSNFARSGQEIHYGGTDSVTTAITSDVQRTRFLENSPILQWSSGRGSGDRLQTIRGSAKFD